MNGNELQQGAPLKRWGFGFGINRRFDALAKNAVKARPQRVDVVVVDVVQTRERDFRVMLLN